MATIMQRIGTISCACLASLVFVGLAGAQPQASSAAPFVGIWLGSENLKGAGAITLDIKADGIVHKLTKDGVLEGSWTLDGSRILLKFDGGELVYEAKIKSGKLMGTATRERTAWAWEATKESDIPGAEPVPKGRPDPRPNGQLAFQDNFDGTPPRAAPLFGASVMSFKHLDGEGHLRGKSRGVLPIVYANEKVRDFQADFEFTTPAPGENCHYGLIFRAAHAEGALPSYYALFLNPKKGTAYFTCWQDGKWVGAKDIPLTAGQLLPRDTNRVRVEALGNEFRVFLNGQFVLQHSDRTLSEPGILGLFTVSDSADENLVVFKKMRVYHPK